MALRLDKYLCSAGIGTRREVKEYIKKGRVYINSITAKSSDIKVEASDKVYFDDKEVLLQTGHKYFIMNKPKGIITATRDADQKTVLDLLDKSQRKDVSPVGRLDKDTTGILLLTDDGALNHRLMSPKNHVSKTYLTGTDIPFDKKDIEAFEMGIDIGDEKPCKSGKLVILNEKNEAGDFMSLITISEGRYHQVKRMAEKCGKTVRYLKRISIGLLKLPADLSEGEYRKMTPEELRLLGVENEE